MIRTRFGDECVLVREATAADIRAFENRKVDKMDRERIGQHMVFIARYVSIETGFVNGKRTKEFTADLSFLRATEGWKEIIDEAAKIQPAVRDT